MADITSLSMRNVACSARIVSLLRAWPELAVLVLFSALWLLGVVALQLPVNALGMEDARFVTRHYFGPIALAAVLQVLLAAWTFRLRRGSADCDRWLALKLLPFVCVVVFLHFNFKAWMPLVNPANYDAAYMFSDQTLWPILWSFRWLRSAIAALSPIAVDSAYHGMFVAAFFISASAHALFDTAKGLRRVVLGMSLVMLIGSVCYWIAPAVGPFIYEPGPNQLATRAQAHMWEMYCQVTDTGCLPAGYFIAPLAAMPSLHVANMLLFVIYARRRMPWIFVAYLPVLGWIIV